MVKDIAIRMFTNRVLHENMKNLETVNFDIKINLKSLLMYFV